MAIDRDKVLQAAQKFVEKKKYDKAVLEYQKLIQADPNDPRTLLKIGDLQSKMAAYPDAISTYESVGRLYAQQGFALKAIAVYKQIREIIAKHAPALADRYGHITPKLGELYQSLGLTSDALAALDEVASRFQQQQRDDEAIEVFRKIVELDPTNPLPHLRLAEALSRIKDVDGAVAEFKLAAEQLASIGRRDDALKVLERLLHHKPDPEQSKMAAELYLARGQPADGMQALAKLQICFQANPRDFDTLSLLARAFTAIGQAAKAIEVQKEMARVARDSGRLDLFREIVESLLHVAPHDDGVRKLAAQFGQTASQMARMPEPSQHQQAPRPAPQAQAPYQPPQQAYQPPQQQYQPPQQQYQPPQPQYQPPQPAYQPPQPAYQPPQQAYQPPQQAYQPPRPAAGAPAAQRQVSEAEVSTGEEMLDEEEYGELLDDDDVIEEGGGAEADAGEVAEAAQAPEATAFEEPPAYGGEPSYRGGEVTEAADTEEQVAQVLADAQSYRRVRLYAKAIEILRIGIEISPSSMDLQEMYRDVLIEAGYTEEAVQVMLTIASLFVDSLDGEAAAQALQDVLAFDPQNQRAIDMLTELGYEIVDEGEGEAGGGEEITNEAVEPYAAHGEAPEPTADGEGFGAGDEYAQDPYAAPRDPYATGDAYAEAGALPSYDLDDSAAHEHAAVGGPARVSEQPPADEHGRDTYLGGEVHELPSFPLDAPDQGINGQAYAEPGYTEAGYDPNEWESPPEAPSEPTAPPQPRLSKGAPKIQDLEEALEESEFFVSRGLYDDARASLVDQLALHPNHPLLAERIAEIDHQIELQRGSGARERPGADRAFDIAESLDGLDSIESARVPPPGRFDDANEQIDVEEVFKKFKEGVAKQIDIEDSDSHYNLGIAYKEMGLIDDAIREFDIAARDPKSEAVCSCMMGLIEMERGNVDEALACFLRGLGAQMKEPAQETMLNFEAGIVYEAKGMGKEALAHYRKAMQRDPNYRDVQERVRRLSRPEPRAASRVVSIPDDDFDRAFDDLIGKS